MLQGLARRASISPTVSRLRAGLAVVILATVGLAGCAQQPQQLAAAGHPKEYFPASVYGKVSPRVVADGQPIPRGGGQYLVGKPYTVAGQTYYPSERRITQVGLASWYGDAFHGRLTANGEVYDRDSFTAAHPTMPLPSYARVTNLRNSTSMIVRVNDRGPYHSNRIMDVSRRVAEALDIRRAGTAKVKVEWVARASLAGSDDAKLAATLRTDGPARLDGIAEPIQVAARSAPEPKRVASLGAFDPAPADREPNAEDDPEETARAPRAAHYERPREAEVDDDQTATFVHRGKVVPHTRIVEARPGTSHRIETHQVAERDMRRGHEARVDHPAPSLRRVASERVMPPARPTRLAMLLPPRPHGAGPRSARPHAH